jgi:hypothetical protein
MLRLIVDENFNGRIVRGLLLRKPGLDLLRVQDIGLSGADDTDVLQAAADEGRVLFTHDRKTVPRHAWERVEAGLLMSGVFIASAELPIQQVIEDILLLAECSRDGEWDRQVRYLPL